MTILFLTRLFYPHIGGVEKHVMELGKRLISKGHKVIVVTEQSQAKSKNFTGLSRSFQSLAMTEIIQGINVYRIPNSSENKFKKFRIWLWLYKNRDLIKKSDFVHCHDVFFWYLPFRFLYPRKPVFTTFHGYESYPIRGKAVLIRKISEKLSWGNICIGDFIKKWYGTNPTFVSYGAVEIKVLPLIRGRQRGFAGASLQLAPKFYEADSKSAPASGYPKNIKHSAVFIGRLDEQTGILTYNETFKKLRKKYPKFEFLVIGDGQYKDLLDKNLKVIGFQKDPEKYFKDYHFAFVSRYLSILEAMAAKRLVFALYDNPVKEDYLKMAPFAKFIIIEDNAKGLADQVEKIINQPKIEQEMVNKAYEWVKKQTWDEMEKIYTTLWKEQPTLPQVLAEGK